MHSRVLDLVVVLSVLPKSVLTEPNVANFLDASPGERAVLGYYAASVYDGFKWANAYSEVNDRPKLFCAPPRLAIVQDQLTDMLERGEEEGIIERDDPLPLALLVVLQNSFPCP